MIATCDLVRIVGRVCDSTLSPIEVLRRVHEVHDPKCAYYALRYYHAIHPLDDCAVEMCLEILLSETSPGDVSEGLSESSYTLLTLCNIRYLSPGQRVCLFAHGLTQQIQKPKWYLEAFASCKPEGDFVTLQEVRSRMRSMISESPLGDVLKNTLLRQLEIYWK